MHQNCTVVSRILKIRHEDYGVIEVRIRKICRCRGRPLCLSDTQMKLKFRCDGYAGMFFQVLNGFFQVLNLGLLLLDFVLKVGKFFQNIYPIYHQFFCFNSFLCQHSKALFFYKKDLSIHIFWR